MNDKKATPAYVPASPLEQLIYDGNVQGTIDYFTGMQASAYAGHRPALRRIGKPLHDISYWSDPAGSPWRGRPTDDQLRAFNISAFLCGTLEERIDACRVYQRRQSELVDMWRRFPPPDAHVLAQAMIASSSGHFSGVHHLYRAGLIARPQHDNYVLGLLSLPVQSDRSLSVRACIADDPGLLHDTVLRLFEIEGTSDNSLTGQDKYGALKTLGTWSGLFLELCAAGVYSRALLLEKTLDVLERDWIQYRAGWFSRFHEALAPAPAEMAPWAARYLGLCHSRIAPTVTLALGALARLYQAGLVDGTSLVSALVPALASSVKAHVTASLKLLEQAVASDPALGAQACHAILPAFGHPAPDVHQRLITHLKSWGMDDAARQHALTLLPHVAAAHRDAMAALLDSAAPAAPAAQAAPPQLRPPLDPLDDSRILPPIADLDELVERTAYVLEHHGDVDELERVLDALLRMARTVAGNRARFGAILKRARALATSHDHWSDDDKPVARELARLLIFLCDGEQLPPAVAYANGQYCAYAFLCERIGGLMQLAAQGHGVAPLAAPTHRRGFIAPALLVERIGQHLQLGVASSLHEQVLSLLRLAPGPDSALLAQARTLPDTRYTRALRYAMGDTLASGENSALFAAAARIRHPDMDDAQLMEVFGDIGPDGPHYARYAFSVRTVEGDNYTYHYGQVDTTPAARPIEPEYLAVMRHPVQLDSGWQSYHRFGGSAEGTVRLSATILPSSLEAFFADGARSLSNNLDWSGAEWHNRAYLAPLLDPSVPFTPMAYYVLACGLAGKEPGQTATAVDALVDGWIEGRLDPAVLGPVLRTLMQTPLVKLARYAKSLSAAARAHVQAPQLVFGLLCQAVRFDLDPPPRDSAALLELMLSLSLELGTPLPAASRSAIAGMTLSGKGKKAQQALLERC